MASWLDRLAEILVCLRRRDALIEYGLWRGGALFYFHFNQRFKRKYRADGVDGPQEMERH